MKKLLALAGAGLLASCATGSPAYANDRDDRPRYEQRYDKKNYKRDNRRWDNRRTWHDPRYYDRNWDRRYRGSSYYQWRYFSRYPSYIYGRCNTRYNVIVRDPYTYRLVCMPRHDYNRYRLEIRIQL